jgi:hypothetical protein
MKQVTYAGTSFVTGSAVADALLALVSALGQSGETAEVQVPAITVTDGATSVDLVIGPASEVVAVLVTTDLPELIDTDVVRSLERQTRALASPKAVLSEQELPSDWDAPDIDGPTAARR